VTDVFTAKPGIGDKVATAGISVTPRTGGEDSTETPKNTSGVGVACEIEF